MAVHKSMGEDGTMEITPEDVIGLTKARQLASEAHKVGACLLNLVLSMC